MKPDESRVVWDGKLFDVVVERWDDREREIVDHPGAVAIVAIDDEGCVNLVRQLREATRGELLELPAGTLDKDGESPLEAAKRELREECGLTGGEWRELASYWTAPGFLRERMTVFLAEGCAQGEASPDEGEEVEVVRWPAAEVESRLGEIADGKTLVGLLLYLRDR
jgi:8-oxo-dGTP pyrophosphatase MutT (NUDIX family)